MSEKHSVSFSEFIAKRTNLANHAFDIGRYIAVQGRNTH